MNGKNLCGSRIRIARIKLKLRQEDVAAALSVDFDITLDRSAIGRIEREERGVTDYELLALAKILHVSSQWLLEGKK